MACHLFTYPGVLRAVNNSNIKLSPLLNFLRTTSDKCNETEYRVICTHSSGLKRRIPSRFSFFLGKCFFFFPETWQPSDLDGFFSKIFWIVMKLSLSKYYLVVYKMHSKLHLISSLRNHLVFLKQCFQKQIVEKWKVFEWLMWGGYPSSPLFLLYSTCLTCSTI